MGKTEELGKNVVIRFCLQEINGIHLAKSWITKRDLLLEFSTFKSCSKRIIEFCYRQE